MTDLLKENHFGGKAEYATEFSSAKLNDRFVFDFDCKNSLFNCPYDKYNAAIYEGCVCEIFISPDRSKSCYYEIELAPNGTLFFAKIIRSNDGSLKLEYLENVLITRVSRDLHNYTAHIEVPFSAIGYNAGTPLFNAYRIECAAGAKDQYLMALNPTLCGAFHKPDYFIDLK